ncbi:MAG: alpha-1,2-fucosyltransferase [Candidatus Goldbacteria bacterium]|nr:alpha-1,2-fucosyltransferase [Candidatus Goldiibacteriota bacterium]
MIIVKIFGGLGNQMFQYALGRFLSVKNSCELKIDIAEYKNYKLHNYGLNSFNITESFADKKECDLIKFQKCSIVERAARKILGKTKRKTNDLIIEKNFRFDPKILELTGNKYLEGYWQSEKYFVLYKEQIYADFTLKHEMNDINASVYKEISDVNSVSFHIRRGDYVSDPVTKAYHGVDLKQYYIDAVELIKEKVKKPYFYIFSDESNWVRENFKGEFEFKVVDCNTGRTGYDDMRLMSACKHNIIANSSFSWWGAWLNRNPGKIVTAPKNWFTDKSIDTYDLIPETWIRL